MENYIVCKPLVKPKNKKQKTKNKKESTNLIQKF